MNYPSIKEYKEAILFAEDNFEQLRNLRPVLDEDGSPVMTSGNFAVVFKMKDEQTGKLHAVKCFLREQEGRAEAYRMIAEELEFVSSTFLTPIKYLDKELFVDTNASEDTEFPVLLMDWVEGETLDKYIRNHLDDQYELSLLAYQFSRLAMWLMPQPFAHGDLKPDNILVKDDGTLVLVDYDGMYVPVMKGQRARELGSPDFRHPSRTETDFDEHIDDFSLASILLSLKAISLQPSLLEEYGAQDRLLFSEKDYRNLSESKAMDALKPLMQDSEQASLYSLFILATSQNNLSGVSFRLFNLKRPSVPSPKESMRDIQISKKNVNQLDKIIIKREVLASFHGKKDIIHLVHNDGSEIWTTDKRKFIDEVKSKRGSRIDTIDNDKHHIIYLYDDCDNKVGIYFIEEHLHGKAPKTISEIKDNVIVIEVWWDSDKKWIPGIGIENRNEKELLPSFQGKKNVWHIVSSNGTESYLTQEWSFDDEACAKGACKLNTVENDKKHVLFLFNDRDAEVGRYYIGKKLQGLTPNQLAEIKNELCVFETWNPDAKKWIPCVGKSEESEKKQKQKNEDLRTEVTEEDLANAWTDEYGVKYSKDKKRLLCADFEHIFPHGYVVMDGVEIICDMAFHVSNHLEKVILPNSLIAIGEAAFASCPKLETIDLPDSLISIGSFAFSDCFSLESITIPDKVVYMGANPFAGSGINIVSCKSNHFETDENALYDEGKRKLISLFHNVSNLDVRDSVITIGDNACWHCYDLQEVYLPDSVETIGNYAFFQSALTYIRISNKLLSIGDEAFTGTNIDEIRLPSCLTSIGEDAFPNLLSIIIQEGTRDNFEKMLPNDIDIIKEEVVVDNHKGLRRVFSKEDVDLVNNAIVVQGTFTKMVCFNMNDGCQTYWPLSKQSKLSIGDSVDLRKAMWIEFSGEGIYYGVGSDGDYYSKYIVEA